MTYHQLRAVCQTFKTVFDCHPGLSQDLLCCHCDPATFSAALTSWLKAKHSVQALILLPESPALKMLLPSRLADPTQLCSVCVSSATTACLSCLAPFTTLTQCQLLAPAEDTLDLQPLRALTNLADLRLQNGMYNGLHLSPNLTGLTLLGCIARDAPNSLTAPALKGVELGGSLLLIHNNGVAACTALENLTMSWSSSITAQEQQHNYRIADDLPAAMSQLVHITSLTVGARKRDLQLSNFSVLTNLCSLQLQLTGPLVVSGDLGCLPSLVDLMIRPRYSDGLCGMYSPAVLMQFNWGIMQHLDFIEISGAVTFDRSLLLLQRQPKLEYFILEDFKPGSVDTMENLAELTQWFEANRPDVTIYVSEEDWLPIGLLD